MKRLTGWDGDRAYILGLKPFEMPVDEEVKIRAVVERLAAYEDIGIEPNTLVDEIPAADVKPMVLCRDCKHKGWIQEPEHGKSVDYCRLIERCVDKQFFCAAGERKTNCGADMRKEDGHDGNL